MANHQKGVQQDTAYSAVAVNDIPVPAYIIFSCFYDHFLVKNDIGMGIHNIMIIHCNCTIGSILLHSFLMICHPYASSFHEMIFILVPLIFLC